MDIFERILSKEEINRRFVTATTAILSNKLISNKASLADSLKVKPTKFSEILNGRMNVGIDMIATMCDSYRVSPDWLLMSRGDNVFRESYNLPKIWVDDDDLKMIYPNDEENVDPNNKKKSYIDSDVFLSMIHDKDTIIKKQAEEIGKLKERILQIEKEKVKNASDVEISGNVNVG